MGNILGIADTTFARYDMGAVAEKTIHGIDPSLEIVRYTVPGIKDLPVACKILIESYDCDIVLAVGMAGKEKIDGICAHEANLGMQQVQLMTNTHIIGVMVHEFEAKDEKELITIMKDRTIKHCHNAVELLKGKDALRKYAGTGRRQGHADAGALR